MKRINNFLNQGEVISREIKPDFIKMFLSSKFTLGGIILAIVVIIAKISLHLSLSFLLIPFILFLIGASHAFLNYTFNTYYITKQKVIIEKGVIGRDYDIVKLDRIMDVKLDVTVVDTIFNTGCIRLCTANEKDTLLYNVKDPKAVIRIIQF